MTMTMAEETITIKAQCHCKTNVFSASVPTSSLPLGANNCHCNSCRHLTGGLHVTYTIWPDASVDLSKLIEYPYSDRIHTFACPKCSCHMFLRFTGFGGPPGVVTGALDHSVPGLLKHFKHVFLENTRDGGASMWLRKTPYGTNPSRSLAFASGHELSYDWPEDDVVQADQKSPEERFGAKASPEMTPFHCHCQGVKFYLRSGTDLASLPANKRPKFVDPATGKYIASMDGCDSCRTTSGMDISYFTFALLTHIHTTDKAPPADQEPEFRTIADLMDAVERRDPKIGTLTRYDSSEGVHRFHCSTCFSSIFYTNDKQPDQVDIGIGLLDHPDGARAEGLLIWALNKIDFAEDGDGGWREAHFRTVKEESEKWRVGRGYPKDFIRVAEEMSADKA